MTNTKKVLKKRLTEPEPNTVENKFSFRLAYALAMRKMSQADLAKACGIAPSNISQYLTKDAEPRQDKIRIIAEKLHVSESWLTGNGKASDIDRRDGSYELSRDEQLLLKAYRSCDMEGQEFLLKMAMTYVRYENEKD